MVVVDIVEVDVDVVAVVLVVVVVDVVSGRQQASSARHSATQF